MFTKKHLGFKVDNTNNLIILQALLGQKSNKLALKYINESKRMGDDIAMRISHGHGPEGFATVGVDSQPQPSQAIGAPQQLDAVLSPVFEKKQSGQVLARNESSDSSGYLSEDDFVFKSHQTPEPSKKSSHVRKAKVDNRKASDSQESIVMSQHKSESRPGESKNKTQTIQSQKASDSQESIILSPRRADSKLESKTRTQTSQRSSNESSQSRKRRSESSHHGTKSAKLSPESESNSSRSLLRSNQHSSSSHQSGSRSSQHQSQPQHSNTQRSRSQIAVVSNQKVDLQQNSTKNASNMGGNIMSNAIFHNCQIYFK